MKRFFKRTLATIMVVLIVLTSAPLNGFVGMKWPELNLLDFSSWFSSKASAKEIDASGSCGKNVTYTYNSETKELVINGSGDTKDYSLNNSPFGTSDVEKVIIEEGIESIGSYLFNRCEFLQEIQLPESLAHIGKYAFNGCSNLKTIRIPDAVTNIEEYAFQSCTNLVSITIPNKITNIAPGLFWGCSGLETVTMPEGLISVGKYSFSGCSSLDHIIIPDNVTTIGEHAFSVCENLKSIIIPDSVMNIGSYAFKLCSSLAKIRIPDNVTDIAEGTFYDCSELEEIAIPDSVINIDDYAFRGCSSLKGISIPHKITNISDGLFYECTNLSSVIIPNCVTTIGFEAFRFAENLTNVYFCGTEEEWSRVSISWQNECLTNATIHFGYKTVSETGQCGEDVYWNYNVVTGEVVISGTGSMYDYEYNETPFYNSNINSVVFKEGVTSIGENAFYYCNYLGDVKISDSVISIGDAAFSGCFQLKNISISDGVKSIGDRAFSDCDDLTSIIVPLGVTRIGYGTYFSCDKLVNVSIPENITSIGQHAFSSCLHLTSVTISNGVTNIETDAFSNCYSLTNINVDVENNYYSNDIHGVLFNKEKTKIVKCPERNAISTYVIPESVTDIEVGAFSDCDRLTSVVIPNGITNIRERTFSYCDNLVNITIPHSVRNIDAWAFFNCENLSDIYYTGTIEQWEKILIGTNNECLTNAKIHYIDDMKSATVVEKKDKYIDNENHDEEQEQYIVIHPKEKEATVIDKFSDFVSRFSDRVSNVEIKGANNQTLIKDEFLINRTEVTSNGILFEKKNYRTYSILKEVLDSWNTYDGTDYSFDMYMEKDTKDGKPYVSSVFGRISNPGEYVDLSVSSVEVYENTPLYVVISVDGLNDGEKIEEYYILQDGEHKVKVNNGNSVVYLHRENFSNDNKIYVYAKTNQGRLTDFKEVKVNVVERMSEETETLLSVDKLSLFGERSSVELDANDESPLLKGMNLGLSLIDCPLSIDVEGNDIKIAIGVDLFKKKVEDTNATDSTKHSEKVEKWSGFKNTIKLFGEEVFDEDGNQKTLDEIDGSVYEKYKKIIDRYWDNDNYYTKKNSKNVGLVGYVEGRLVNGKLIVTDVYGMVTGEIKVNHTHNTVVYVVPVYFYVEGGAEGSAKFGITKIVPDTSIPFDLNFQLSVEPFLKVGGGVGIKEVISAGIYGKGSLPTTLTLSSNVSLLSKLKGELGIEAEFFIFKGNIELLKSKEGITVFEGNWSPDKKLLRSFEDDYMINMPTAEIHNVVSVASRDYLEESAGWLGEYPVSTYSLADKGISYNLLDYSVYGQTQSQIVSFGDNVMMVWIQDPGDAVRDEYNRMRLVYSLYDKDNKTWSEPKAVYDDDYNDAYPSLATDGESVYVAWQKIDKKVTKEDIVIDGDETVGEESFEVFLKNSEIFVAKYDEGSDCFINATKLTDNEIYDYIPSVIVKNGNAVVYYASNSDNNLSSLNSNTIYRHELGGDACVVADKQNYIISATAEIVDDEEKLSYSVDTDDNMSTTGDVTIHTLAVEDTVSGKKFTSFEKNENDAAYTYADYSLFDGKETLFVSDMSNIYYEQEGEVKSVFNDSRLIEGNISFVEQTTGLSILWTENNKVGGNDFWSTSYEDGIWTEPVKISNFGGNRVSQVDIAMFGGTLVGVCNLTEIEFNEESGTGTPKSTSLCSFTANDFNDISIDLYNISENEIIPGETSTLDVYVNNVGTTDVSRIKFVVSDTLGTEMIVIKDIDLKSGAKELVSLEYVVPENYGKTTLTVSASAIDEEENEVLETDVADNTESMEIGKGDLSIVERKIDSFGDNYVLKAVVENNSVVDAENIVVSAMFNDPEGEAYGQYSIDILGKEQYIDYELIFNKDSIEFDENGVGKLYLNVTSSSDESAEGDNQICVIVSLPSDATCAHPLTETVEAKESTCTECGFDEHDICSACKEKLTEYVEHPIIDHKDTNMDNKCDSCGKSMSDILVGETKTIEIKSNEITYLKFIPYETAEYTFESNSDEDTYGYLYDVDKNQLTCNDDGGSERNFSVSYTLTAGETYYWGARFYDEDEGGTFDVMLTTQDQCRHKNAVLDEGTLESCISIGYTAGTYCNDCETWIEGHEVIPATNHLNQRISILWDATCEESGYMEGIYCLDCNEWIEGAGTIEPKGHDYENDICKNCGMSRVDNCRCMCHKNGVMGVVWKIFKVILKTFKANSTCSCGVAHY